MAPKAAAAAAGASAAKQGRSRKRRKQQEHTWSSSDDSSSDEDESTPAEPQAGPSTQRMDLDGESETESESESSEASSSEPSDSSDSDDSSDDEDDDDGQSTAAPVQANGKDKATIVRPPRPRAPTLSPSPPPRNLPSFLSDPKIVGKEKRQAEEEDRRTRFRKVYMDKLVQGFGGDLEKLRESETNLDAHVLQILIDALGSGTDVYNDAKATGEGIDEVGVLLGDKQ